MKIIFILLICLTAANNVLTKRNRRLDDEWLLFKKAFNKTYSNFDVEIKRNSIWENNLKMIVQHNEEADLRMHTYRLEMNEFGDLTHKEFANKYLTKVNLNYPIGLNSNDYFLNDSIPDNVDWAKCVLPVRDSFRCSANWAFSIVESLSGISCIKTNKLTSLSAQQLIDCSFKNGNQGCSFGYLEASYKYIIDNKGLDTEASYPFKEEVEKCHFNPADVACTLNGYRNIITGNETDLTFALAKVGPISTAFNAGLPSFQFYRSGIYNDPKCDANIDHLFLLTGYGSLEKNQDFYKAKNSWGTSWGMDGYVLVARNRNNACGVASYASYGLVN